MVSEDVSPSMLQLFPLQAVLFPDGLLGLNETARSRRLRQG